MSSCANGYCFRGRLRASVLSIKNAFLVMMMIHGCLICIMQVAARWFSAVNIEQKHSNHSVKLVTKLSVFVARHHIR